ncbi:MAG: hypothetical protein ACSHXF_11870 [Aquaticitalea sp.]
MSKPIKIILIVVASILILGVVGALVVDSIVKSKVVNYLNNQLPENVELSYESIEVSTWSGRVVLVSPKIKNIGKSTGKLNAKLDLDSLVVDGFGYWDYLMNDKISVESIEFRQPNLIYYHNPLVSKSEYKYSKLEKLKQDISIQRINIQKGEVSVRNLESDSLMLKTENFTANVMGIQLNEKSVKQRIPFAFSDYNVHFNNLFYQMSPYENLEISTSKLTKGNSKFDGLKLYTKYSKSQFDRMIPYERDHFDITINSVELNDQDFGYEQDSVFYFKSPSLIIEKSRMNIYRNKLIADDTTIKSLYSKMLRNLKFNLTLNEILLKNATINYSEKVKAENTAGTISFSKLNAKIKNLSNTYSGSEKTTLDIDAIFMKSTPINVNWYFDVNNVNDHFIFKADIGRLPAKDLNPFAQPNLKVKFEGELLKTYFTIDGNAQDANVDLRINYDNFKVVILQKDGKEKNNFLSAVANLFIKKDSGNESDHYREGYKNNVERDKTKSVFNFIWLNASAGLLNALTGDGKK